MDKSCIRRCSKRFTRVNGSGEPCDCLGNFASCSCRYSSVGIAKCPDPSPEMEKPIASVFAVVRIVNSTLRSGRRRATTTTLVNDTTAAHHRVKPNLVFNLLEVGEF